MAAKKLRSNAPVEKRMDLVLEGGGVKGLALVGALAALEEHGYIPQNIAGTSIGAVVGALLAAGYSAGELRKIMLDRLDFRRFKDLGYEASLPVVGKPLNLLFKLGVYQGAAIENELAKLLKAKGVVTFADLSYHGEDADTDPVYHYKLQVVVSDLTARRMLVLPRDAEVLGMRPDQMNVAQTVRMSMSVPIFFEPMTVAAPDGEMHVLVDGGLLSNFPLRVFDLKDPKAIPPWPTFGLHLVKAFEATGITDRIPPIQKALGNPAAQLSSYLLALCLTALEAQDLQYIEEDNFARTIPIQTLGVGLLDFGISEKVKEALYKSGYAAAQDFLQRWDFLGYIAAYRSGREYHRREDVAMQMQQATADPQDAGLTPAVLTTNGAGLN